MLETAQYQAITFIGWSILVIFLMKTCERLKNREASSAARATKLTTSMPGRSMIITPPKPTAVAVQRRQPTTSCRNSTASTTMNSGRAKPMAVASASGMFTTE